MPSTILDLSDSSPLSASIPKKKVLLMSDAAFIKFLSWIDTHIAELKHDLERYKDEVDHGDTAHYFEESDYEDHVSSLKDELIQIPNKIDKLNRFLTDIKNSWGEPKDRVIGFVCWAPALDINVSPHGYSQDLCVVELYKEKFQKMIGNVLSLGKMLRAFHSLFI